jgi:hypothetical protein
VPVHKEEELIARISRVFHTKVQEKKKIKSGSNNLEIGQGSQCRSDY